MKRFKLHHTSRKLIISILVGILFALIFSYFGFAIFSPLIIWDIAIIIYVVWVWSVIWGMGPTETKSHAVREDPGRTIADVLLLGASIVSLVAVTFLMMQAVHIGGTLKVVYITLGLISIIASWVLVHTTYALKYARFYYREPGGEVSFNEDDLPRYSDFAYLAFTIGMAFQVSDTCLKAKEIRVTVFRHALLSFAFNTVIIASTVNIIANLT